MKTSISSSQPSRTISSVLLAGLLTSLVASCSSNPSSHSRFHPELPDHKDLWEYDQAGLSANVESTMPFLTPALFTNESLASTSDKPVFQSADLNYGQDSVRNDSSETWNILSQPILNTKINTTGFSSENPPDVESLEPEYLLFNLNRQHTETIRMPLPQKALADHYHALGRLSSSY